SWAGNSCSASVAPAAIGQQPPGGEPSRAAQDSGAGMRSGAAQVETRDRRAVAAPTGHGPHEQYLVEAQLAMRERTLAEAEALLEVERGQRHAMLDARAES